MHTTRNPLPSASDRLRQAIVTAREKGDSLIRDLAPLSAVAKMDNGHGAELDTFALEGITRAYEAAMTADSCVRTIEEAVAEADRELAAREAAPRYALENYTFDRPAGTGPVERMGWHAVRMAAPFRAMARAAGEHEDGLDLDLNDVEALDAVLAAQADVWSAIGRVADFGTGVLNALAPFIPAEARADVDELLRALTPAPLDGGLRGAK